MQKDKTLLLFFLDLLLYVNHSLLKKLSNYCHFYLVKEKFVHTQAF